MDAFTANQIEDANDVAVGRPFVAADVDWDVGVDSKSVGEVLVEIHHVHLLFLEPNFAIIIDGDINDVGFEIALGHGGCRQIHSDGLQFHHAQACEHERSKEEEHDVDQWNDLDTRFSVGKWRANLHWEL